MRRDVETIQHLQRLPRFRREDTLLVRDIDLDRLRVDRLRTNSFIAGPIARELGVPHLLATVPEEQDGEFTGRAAGVPAFREGKITRLMIWLAERGERLEDFQRTYFYSDSLNDLPLLSLVSHPVAVDPDPTLRAHAARHGWPVITLR